MNIFLLTFGYMVIWSKIMLYPNKKYSVEVNIINKGISSPEG